MVNVLRFILGASTLFAAGAQTSSITKRRGLDTSQLSPTKRQAQSRDIQNRLNASRRPNIVFILTDDQDLHLGSLDYLPFVKQHLTERGTFFRRHYCHVSLCCPSRVSLWTGREAHNTNVTDVNPPYGGYPKFIREGLHDKYLPSWLQAAGYNTYYTGKLFNAHTIGNYDKPFAAGFNGSDFLLDPYTYQYLNSTFQRNKDAPVSYENRYSTDVLADKVYGFLDEAVASERPFFLGVAPIAPHSNLDDRGFTEPIAAERHKDLFPDARVPRTDSFNPKQASGVSWIRDLPLQDDRNVAYNDHFYRQRLRSLQAVDEIVDGVVSRLNQHGILGNTYIIFTSDNGFHIGQHRLQPGKTCGYEEDINVPLVITGPDVPQNVTSDIVTTHTDLAPTLLKLAGLNLRPEFDGSPIPITSPQAGKQEHVNVEHWGNGIEEGLYGNYRHPNTTYKAVRLIGERYNLHYTVWCNNEHELYDLTRDPHQLENLLSPPHLTLSVTTLLGHPLHKVVARLDALLLVLKTCKARSCTHPWETLHPAGGVSNLQDALLNKYDGFYEQEQRRVSFSRCEPGYIPDAEGAQFGTDGFIYQANRRWSSEWT